MNLAPNYQAYQDMTDTVNAVVHSKKAFASIKGLVGKSTSYALAILPVGALRLILWYMTSRIEKSYKHGDICITSENYNNVMYSYLRLKKLQESKSNIVIHPKKAHWLFRGLARDLKRMLDVSHKFWTQLDNAVQKIDDVPKLKHLRHIPAEELYSNRNHAYQYKL